MRGAWTGDTLRLAGAGRDGGELVLEMSLEPSTFDGEPSVRISVAPEARDDGALIDDLHEAMRRDPATGLYGREYFIEKLGEKAAKPAAAGVRALALIRPDGFGDVVEVVGPHRERTDPDRDGVDAQGHGPAQRPLRSFRGDDPGGAAGTRQPS